MSEPSAPTTEGKDEATTVTSEVSEEELIKGIDDTEAATATTSSNEGSGGTEGALDDTSTTTAPTITAGIHRGCHYQPACHTLHAVAYDMMI
jgi:hypothetical protein